MIKQLQWVQSTWKRACANNGMDFEVQYRSYHWKALQMCTFWITNDALHDVNSISVMVIALNCIRFNTWIIRIKKNSKQDDVKDFKTYSNNHHSVSDCIMECYFFHILCVFPNVWICLYAEKSVHNDEYHNRMFHKFDISLGC